MPLLSEKDSAYLREEFAKQLVNPVRLVMFTQEKAACQYCRETEQIVRELVMFTQEKAACQYCRETEQIVREVAGLSDRIEVEVHNFIADGGKAKEYDIARIPAIAVIGEKDYGVRFYGIPSGYEFTTLIEDIMAIAQGKSGLSDATREAVAALTEPVHVQVFITPTCPYCPRAVRLAHQLAIESDLIRGDMVEAIEFPQLANRYQVMGVPRSVFNETVSQEGAVPEPIFVARLLQVHCPAAGGLSAGPAINITE